jgi:putative NIF3 family GTP cyclohydrolase 1 type 2
MVADNRSQLDPSVVKEKTNMRNPISRRRFVQWMSTAVAAATTAGTRSYAEENITALQVVERIQAKLATQGVAWRSSHFDGYHLGDPNARVTGIATTFQPSLDVLQRAVAQQKNFVICHESTFWDGFDPIQVMTTDPVHEAKIQFAKEHRMVVWRIHDHWHRIKPDPIFMGLARKLDWIPYYDASTWPGHYTIPETPLEQVARHIQTRLNTSNVVVVGDRTLPVKTIGDCAHILSSVLPTLHTYDVALVGETPEHDSFEYVRDAVALGEKKALVMISHEALEEWGMEDFAAWLRPIVPELPVSWVGTGDPFEVPPVHL